MEHPLISVIIPTYNRKDILQKTLLAIQQQEGVDLEKIEVVVVDDGGSDGTSELIETFRQICTFSLVYLQQKNQGQGSARNHALTKASGYLVLFLGDDIILDSLALSEHLRVHRKYHADNIACLGFTTWHPEIAVSPFMHFLEHGGPQFNYPALEKQPVTDWELGLRDASFWYFYTSNISLKRSLLLNKKFEQVYTSYGWEDIDFGYGLEKEKKLKILYNPKAKGYHWHEISETSFRERMHSVGKNALVFQNRYPDVRVVPQGLKKAVFHLLAWPPLVWFLRQLGKILPAGQQLYYYALSKKYFLEGLRS